MESKKCASCGRTLSLSLFARNRAYKGGYRNVCRSCWNERTTARRYGMSQKEYLKRRKESAYCCEICGIMEKDLNHILHVDHDHVTGNNRGFLCRNCNSMLGMAQDNIDILRGAIKYLGKYKQQQTRFAIGLCFDEYTTAKEG